MYVNALLGVSDGSAAIIAAGIAAGASILGAHWSRSAKRELKPNGGSSTKDAVSRVEGKIDGAVDVLTKHLEVLDRRLTDVELHVNPPQKD